LELRSSRIGREKLLVPQFAISGIHSNPGKMQFCASIQLFPHCGGGPCVNDCGCQHGVDLAALDGLIASGGLRVYVFTAALRAAFSDA
jgi:hypothetical protein